MDNIKIKEQELLQTLSKLDLFTDLVANSKKKIVDLETVKTDLEVEKNDLIEKLSTFESENKLLLKQLTELKNKNLSASSNEDLNDKIITIEDENNKLRKEIAIMEEELEVSRYKVLEGEKKQKKVSEKLDELNQETENLFEKDEW
tara:strand:+ start:365 stop:802 length:438 start_codon:yes stop_codon:yes gene_type:complete